MHFVMLAVKKDVSPRFASQYPRRMPPLRRDFQDVVDRCIGKQIEFKATKKRERWKVVVVAAVAMNMCSIMFEIPQLTWSMLKYN